MNSLKIGTFCVIGIEIRTTNENGRSSTDIPELWNKFMSEGIMDKIPNKMESSIYCIYTDYQSDHTKPYSTILGCKVSDLSIIPSGMTGRIFTEDNYVKRLAKGNLLQGAVFNEWLKIWSSDIPRAFKADFEIYGENAKNPENAEVEIFISIK